VLIRKAIIQMRRSKRQLAAVRQAQTQTPLTPDLYAPAPTPAAQPAPTPTAAELAAQREERIEADVRSRAVVFEARHFLQVAERERDVAKATLVKERASMQEEMRKLQSRAERDLLAERAENAKIILALRSRVEYLEQGSGLNRLHPQKQTPENQEITCQKKNQ
jgi:hypothetical protein